MEADNEYLSFLQNHESVLSMKDFVLIYFFRSSFIVLSSGISPTKMITTL